MPSLKALKWIAASAEPDVSRLRALPRPAEGAFDAGAAFLHAVEDRLRAAVTDRDDGTPGLLREASRTLVLAPGAKRLRPLLTMVLATELGVRGADAVRVAAAAELMHAASLLHDDVIDEGTLRRGLPTANARWGNAAAVLAGDWLLTQAFQELAGLPASLTASAIPAVAEMTGAAILEIETRGRTDLTMDGWRRIAQGKTGVLFAWCGRAVALLARREDAAMALDAFGTHLGVAFQMADDLGDVVGAPGKDRFSDIRSKTPSSVLVLAMTEAPALRACLARAWEQATAPEPLVEEIGGAVLRSGAPEAALALVERELAHAQAAAQPFVGATCATELQRLGERFARGLRRGQAPVR
jgi:octaprenyl-diphosphate synthase